MSKKFFGKILSGLLCLMMTAVIFCPDNAFKANAGDVSEMSPNQNTYDFIFQLEGCDLHCFWDVAQWTIGYGTRCPYHHSGKGSYTGQRGGHTINKEQAMDIFKEEFPQYVKHSVPTAPACP